MKPRRFKGRKRITNRQLAKRLGLSLGRLNLVAKNTGITTRELLEHINIAREKP